MSDESTQQEGGARRELFVMRLTAVAFVALGGVALYEALRIAGDSGLSPSEAAFFPLIVSVGLLAFGSLFLIRVTVLPDREIVSRATSAQAATRWRTVGLIAASLIVYVFVLAPLGYILATGLLIPVVTRILGSRHRYRDPIVGFGLAIAIYVGFQFLGVRLPEGVLGIFL